MRHTKFTCLPRHDVTLRVETTTGPAVEPARLLVVTTCRNCGGHSGTVLTTHLSLAASQVLGFTA